MKELLNKTIITLKKNAPQILMWVGIAGTVTATVLACKASTKVVEEVIEPHKENMEKISKMSDNDEIMVAKIETYANTTLGLIKLYGGAAVLGCLSLTAIISSNGMMVKRNAQLVAAYGVLNKMYKTYRKNVVERFGKEVDEELYFGSKKEVTKENGKKVERNLVDENSDYITFFDDRSYEYEDNATYNLNFIHNVENLVNSRLKSRVTKAGGGKAFLYLEEVYKELAMWENLNDAEKKRAQVVGWCFDEEDFKNGNKIDFGVNTRMERLNNRALHDCEPVIAMDFNVDGTIWNLM